MSERNRRRGRRRLPARPRPVRPCPLDLQAHELPKAPELCLAMFDELKAIGLDAFTKKHDPYWDIPLNDTPRAGHRHADPLRVFAREFI